MFSNGSKKKKKKNGIVKAENELQQFTNRL